MGEAQASVYYIDAVAGYYYIVQGNYDVFYIDSNGNRFWVQAYQWDINGSYIIFQSPVTGRLYLVVSNSVKPILSTIGWFSAPVAVSYPAVTVVFPAPWGTTRSDSISPSSISILVSASYSPATGVTVVNTTTLSFNNALITLSAPSASSANRYTWYNATVTVSYVASLTYNATVTVRSIFGVDTLQFYDGSLYYKLPVTMYVHAYGFSSNQSVVVGAYTGLEDTSSYTTTLYHMLYYVTVRASGAAVFTESRTYAPDSLGRIVAANGNILVDATGKLQRATASYTISSMSLMLYATSLRVTLSNDTTSGLILAINTTEVAQRVKSINPVVYVRELNSFYPLALYGYGSEKTIIAVPAVLSAGTYTIDIIWNYPFVIGSWANITATVYDEPGDVLARLLISGYVEANTIAEPHYVKIVGAASFTLLAGRLVEVNMSYAPEADLPIALPFVDGGPIYIEMPLSNGTVYRATLTAYDGAVYAPHIYAWHFDGVDDYVSIPYSASIDFSDVKRLTYCGWVNLVSPTRGDIYIHLFTGTDQWQVYWRATDDSPYFQWSDTSNVTRALLKSGLYLTRGAFHHVCFSMDFTGSQPSIEVVNGVLQASSVITQMFNEVNRNADFPETTFNGYIAQVLLYSHVLSSSEINNVYAYNIVNSSGLVLFLDPTFYNGTHYIDLSGSGNHGVPHGVARVLDNRTWIYTVLNSPLGMSGYVTFRFFPPGARIAYGPYTVELAQTLRPVLIGNHTLYVPRAGDTLVGNLTIYSITVYDTVYPVDPVNATITVLSPVALNPYPLHVISLAMGISRGSWAYKIPVYISFHEIPQHASLTLRLKLPLGVWIKQRLLSPSLEDLAIVSSEGELLPFLVLYWESTDYAVVYVKYPKPLQSTTLTLYVYLKNTLLWGCSASFQSLSAFDLINPSGAFTFTDPVWNYTLMSTMGVYNYYVFTSWDKILIASTPTDGVLLDPSGELIEYHGAYKIERDITPITAAKELSIVVKGSAFHVYADGTPALSVDLASIFPAGVPTTIYYVGWSGTAVYVSTTSFYTYSVGNIIGGVQEAPPAQVNRPSQQQSPPTFDWWSTMPMLFILVVLAVVVKLISGGTTSGQGGGVRLP